MGFDTSVVEPVLLSCFDLLAHPKSLINSKNSTSAKTSAGLSSKTSVTLSGSSAENNIPSANENNLRIVVANVNNISGKRAEVITLCDTVKPDIILAESKLDKRSSTQNFYLEITLVILDMAIARTVE